MWMNSNRPRVGVFVMPVRIAAVCIGLLMVSPTPAFAKSLHWPSMDVTATLEANGDLRVTEILVYEFDGDWNGGERSLNLRSGQYITVQEIARVDPATGTRTPLRHGSLDDVDNWYETSTGVLRWRSRLPTDPPFEKKQITYAIDYTYRGAVVRDGEQLRMAHDFAFSNRPGSIDRFTLTLDFDPAWQVPVLSPLKREATNLMPGDGVIVTLDLKYTGDSSEVNSISPQQEQASASGGPLMTSTPRPTRVLMLQALAAASLLMLVWFLVREIHVGRFSAIDPTPVDAAWLEREILAHPPEVVGAAWDGSVNDSEVAATLMRLQSEEKINATFGSGDNPTFRMQKLRPLESFSGYERKLLEGYFVDGDTVTSEELRLHYKESGFNPVQLIQTELTERVSQLFGEPPAKNLSAWLGCPMFLAGPVLVAAGLWRTELRIPAIVISLMSLIILSIITGAMGNWFSSRVDRGLPFLIACAIPAVIAIGVSGWLVWRLVFPTMTVAGIVVIGFSVFYSFFATARSNRGRQAMEGRKRLVRARSHFERELASANPALDDAWYPWIVAFGLEKNVTKWADSFAGESSSLSSVRHRSSSSSNWSSGSSGSSSSSGSSWTGGGGSFGGAGASGAWAAAATSIASASSSSGSSGGGGGGSSSSGGGGGGGW